MALSIAASTMEAIRTRAQALRSQGRTVEEAVATIEAELRARYPGWARANGIAAAARSAYTEGR